MIKEKVNNFWQNNPSDYFDIFTASQEKYYAALANYVKNGDMSILDYGCGSGNLINFIPEGTNITIFDINRSTTEIALRRFKNRDIEPIFNIENLESDQFSLAYFSLVLTCIENISDIEFAFNKIYNSLEIGGRLILGTTHPCFRNQKFSYFHTEYLGKQYKYFDEGKGFKVYLQDKDKSIAFSDYHWSLGFTLNLLLKSEYKILRLEEVYDDGINCNDRYPPYIIIECQKHK
jgi:SAM-dependent methyltransferase